MYVYTIAWVFITQPPLLMYYIDSHWNDFSTSNLTQKFLLSDITFSVQMKTSTLYSHIHCIKGKSIIENIKLIQKKKVLAFIVLQYFKLALPLKVDRQ